MARNKKNVQEQYESAFAVSLRKLMETKGVTQDVLAGAVGKTRQTVSQYVNGVSEPPYETLSKIADYFDVSVDYLFGRTKIKRMDPVADQICISEENVALLQLANKGLQNGCEEWIAYLQEKGWLREKSRLEPFQGEVIDKESFEKVLDRVEANEARTIARASCEIVDSLVEAVFLNRDLCDGFIPIINPDMREGINDREYLNYQLFRVANAIIKYLEWKYDDHMRLFENSETPDGLLNE